jgi:hypothetical protein
MRVVQQERPKDNSSFYLSRYLHHPVFCLYCGCDDIQAGDWHADYDKAWQYVSCGCCGKKWSDCYKLTEVADSKGNVIV